ncbi:MAG: hypothetical protein LBP51_03295, partial [Deferribacteraceae bacterium]|nr:hypothetical protein [Deferribacteraceae bacterium]
MSIKINPDQSTVALLRRSVVKRERIPEQTEKAKVAVKPKESIREIIAEKVEQAVSKHREKSAETLKESLAELKEAFTL